MLFGPVEDLVEAQLFIDRAADHGLAALAENIAPPQIEGGLADVARGLVQQALDGEEGLGAAEAPLRSTGDVGAVFGLARDRRVGNVVGAAGAEPGELRHIGAEVFPPAAVEDHVDGKSLDIALIVHRQFLGQIAGVALEPHLELFKAVIGEADRLAAPIDRGDGEIEGEDRLVAPAEAAARIAGDQIDRVHRHRQFALGEHGQGAAYVVFRRLGADHQVQGPRPRIVPSEAALRLHEHGVHGLHGAFGAVALPLAGLGLLVNLPFNIKAEFRGIYFVALLIPAVEGIGEDILASRRIGDADKVGQRSKGVALLGQTPRLIDLEGRVELNDLVCRPEGRARCENQEGHGLPVKVGACATRHDKGPPEIARQFDLATQHLFAPVEFHVAVYLVGADDLVGDHIAVEHLSGLRLGRQQLEVQPREEPLHIRRPDDHHRLLGLRPAGHGRGVKITGIDPLSRHLGQAVDAIARLARSRRPALVVQRNNRIGLVRAKRHGRNHVHGKGYPRDGLDE